MGCVKIAFGGLLMLALIQGAVTQIGERLCPENGQPYVKMCQAGKQNGTSVYIDTTGAPEQQAVKCTCRLVNTDDITAQIIVNYMITRPQRTKDCGMYFQIDDVTWGCAVTDNVVKYSNTPNNLTFVKNHTERVQLYACIELSVWFGKLSVECFASEQYQAASTAASTTTTQALTTTSTTTTMEHTTPESSTSTTTTTTISTPAPTTTTLSTSTATPAPTTTTNATSIGTTPTPTPSSSTGSSSEGNPTDLSTQKHTITTSPSNKTITTTTDATPTTSSAPTSSPSGVPPEDPEAKAKQTDEDGTNWGVIGAVIGVCFLLLFILLVICLVCRRRRRKEKKPEPTIAVGPRTIRFSSVGDDVVVTENRLYNYDGENPTPAMNAMFIGGIPATPGASENHIPTFTPDPDAEYAVIMDSHRSKVNGKDRPKLAVLNDDKQNAEDTGENGAKGGAEDTDKKLPFEGSRVPKGGVENPGYEPDYLVPYDNSSAGSLSTRAGSDSTSPYSYIEHDKLRMNSDKSEADREEHYTRFPSNTYDDDGQYKRLFSSASSEPSPDGYVNSPAKDDAFFSEEKTD